MLKNFFKRLPITRKLTLVIMATSTLGLLVAVLGFVSHELSFFVESASAELSILAQVVAANAATALDFEDPVAARDLLASLSAEPHVVSGCLYRLDGALFARYERPGAERTCPPRAPPLGVRFAFDGLDLAAEVTTRTDGERIGTIRLASDLGAMRARLRRYALIVAALILVSSLIAYVVSARLQPMVSEPILRLATAARRVSVERDYSVRSPVRSEDEVGALTGAFNEMLSQIQERDRELQERHRTVEQVNRELEREVAERRRAEERVRSLADTDALTELPNRRLFNDRLRMALGLASRRGVNPSVLFLDLDRFKLVNDSLGHRVGDLLLQQVAERLRSRVRHSDTVARLGGDEFTVLLPDALRATDAARTAEKILEALRAPFHLDGHEVFVTPSIGIAIYPDDGTDVDTLLRNADAAMYRAKEAGRDTYRLYTSTMNAQALERLGMESALRRALSDDGFHLHYQPVMDAARGTLVAFEGLLRWAGGKQGELVAPGRFIPLAESTGLIIPIGRWALRTACRQARAWQEAGLPHATMAVNLSPRQLQQLDLVENVKAALEESGLEPGSLELELTESGAMQSADTGIRILGELKQLGVRLSLDDFGTGHSSLGLLRRLPVDTLKIDAAFVRELPGEPEDAAIVTAIIDMSHALDLEVVAEGVERQEQLDFLRKHGCDRVQGYLFAPPLPASECEGILQKARPAPRGRRRSAPRSGSRRVGSRARRQR